MNTRKRIAAALAAVTIAMSSSACAMSREDILKTALIVGGAVVVYMIAAELSDGDDDGYLTITDPPCTDCTLVPY